MGWSSASQNQARTPAGRPRGFRSRSRRLLDPPWADHWVQLLHGSEPLRPSQNLRRGRGQCHRDRISSRWIVAAEDAVKVRALLISYLGKRIEYYNEGRDPAAIRRINKETSKLQDEMWTAAQTFADGPAKPRKCVGRFRNERCDQFAGLLPGCLVESDSRSSLGPDDSDCAVLQCPNRIWRASTAKKIDETSPPCVAASCFHFLLSHSGH